jgi:hypothetical protein
MIRKKPGRHNTRLDFQPLEPRRVLTALTNSVDAFDSIGIGQSDTYTFSVDSPGTVIVSVGETGPFFAEPRVEVFRPGGASVAVGGSSSNSGSSASVQFTATETGIYSIAVSEFGNNEAMAYRIRALSLPSSPTLQAGRDKVLSNGEETLSSIPLGGFAVFPFEVGSAGNVLVSVGEVDSFGAEPKLEIFGPSGTSIDVGGSTSNSSSSALIQFDQTLPGTYTAVVSDFGNNESMEFRIRALSVPATPELLSGRDDLLQNGESKTATTPIGGFAVYPFTVDSAGTVVVSVGEVDSFGAEPRLQVLGPDGQSMGIGGSTSNSSSDARVQFVTTASGTYTAIVSEFGNDETMSFQIRSLTVPGSPQLLDSQDQTLQNGEEVLSSIPSGTFAVFPFEVLAAGTARVTVSETSGFSAEPELEIFGPDGLSLGTGGSTSNSSNTATVQISAIQTGTYTAVVRDFSDDDAMEFRIRAITVPGNPEMIAARDSILTDDTPVISSIPAGAYAVFPFQVTSLGTINVGVTETGTLIAEPRVQVFGPDGQSVSIGGSSSNSSNSAAVSFSPSQLGTYTAIVSDFSNNEEMDFAISADGIDTVPTRITSFKRDGEGVASFDQLRRPDLIDELKLQFNQDVAIEASDLVFHNDTTSGTVDLSAATFNYDTGSMTATWDLSTLASSLPAGFYTASIAASAVTSTDSGSILESTFSQAIYVALPGDANLDGRVDVLGDGFTLVGNLSEVGGATWALGDFNADGNINVLGDGFVLVGRLGQSVVPPGSTVASLMATGSSGSTSSIDISTLDVAFAGSNFWNDDDDEETDSLFETDSHLIDLIENDADLELA